VEGFPTVPTTWPRDTVQQISPSQAKQNKTAEFYRVQQLPEVRVRCALRKLREAEQTPSEEWKQFGEDDDRVRLCDRAICRGAIERRF